MSSSQNNCTRAPDRAVRRRVRWCSFDMFASPLSRDAAAGSGCAESPTRFSFGHSLRACVLVARSCAHLRSVRPSDWRDPVIPLDQRCNDQYSWSEIEPSCGCPDPGALTMLDQPSDQSQDNSLPAAERHSATGDQPAIIDEVFCLQDSCNVVEQKMHMLRTRGSRRPQ